MLIPIVSNNFLKKLSFVQALIIKRLGEGIVKWTGFALSWFFCRGPLFRLS